MGYPGYLYQHYRRWTSQSQPHQLWVYITTASIAWAALIKLASCKNQIFTFRSSDQLLTHNFQQFAVWNTKFWSVWCFQTLVDQISNINNISGRILVLPRETTNFSGLKWVEPFGQTDKPFLLVPLDSGRKSEGQPRSQSVCRRLLRSPQGNPSLIGSDDLWLGKKMDLWRIYPTRS